MITRINAQDTQSRLNLIADITYKVVPVFYGQAAMNLQFSLLRRYPDKKQPLILWIDGGAWRDINHNNFLPELSFLAEEGYAVAQIGHRTSADGLWPSQIEDVKAAVRYIRAHAEELGIDPEHIGTMGASSGGHLSNMLGVTGNIRRFDVGENLNQSSAVSCVVDIYGPADLSCDDDIYDPMSPESRLIGDKADRHPDIVADISPVNYVSSEAAPVLIFHGENDRAVPIEHSHRFYKKLTEAGVPVDFYIWEGADHGDPRLRDPQVRSLVLEFFAAHLR